MLENDVQLIRRVLSGDDSAFSTLVDKHQKGVHALIWRKLGDFHYAEEITQDTFVQAYKKLGTLRDPNHFSGWLYVIANRLSINWLQRRKPTIPSLEDTPVEEIEDSSYNHYITEERETKVTEHRSEVVKDLLATLPESERTVVTLYYLGEMTAKEIGKFLGVSVNTIKSRLRRGRSRLKESESLVQEMLGELPLSTDLTHRVMQEVADINPLTPPVAKPLLPWAALGTAAVVIVLMLGATQQFLDRFQRPYSFEAKSEPTIEIMDAPIVLDTLLKPSIRRQLGQASVPGRNVGAGTEFTQATLTSTSTEDLLKFSDTQWSQTNAPPGGHVHDIFTVSDGTAYAVSTMGVYKLESEATSWRRLNMRVPIDESPMPVVENQGTLYIVSTDEIYASVDKGETWHLLCSRPAGNAVGFIITDAPESQSSQSDITMYLALREAGVFRSTDGGVKWDLLNKGLTNHRISTIAAIGESVFTGTNRGLYRLNLGTWRKLPVAPSKTVYSLVVLENNLYTGMGPDLHGLTPMQARSVLERGEPSSGRIYRSQDLGASWKDITPNGGYSATILPSGVKLLARGGTLLALGATEFRSTDAGDTWTSLGLNPNSFMLNSLSAAAGNDRTFYKVGAFGIHRTTDSGESWHPFMDGVLGNRIADMIAFNNRLLAHTGYEVYQSTDEGRSWKKVPIRDETLSNKSPAPDRSNFDAKFLIAGRSAYFIVPENNLLQIFRLSADGNLFIPIQNIPPFESNVSARQLNVNTAEIRKGTSPDPPQPDVERRLRVNAFAIGNNAFYAEYNHRLLKWKIGDRKWSDIGFMPNTDRSDDRLNERFKLAAFGETLYVGRRDGKLFRSLDGGENWRDITPHLPLRFLHFKEIAFVGAKVYVATDQGVLVSETGDRWRLILDEVGRRIVINRLAVNGPAIYGVTDVGVYRLDMQGDWSLFSAEVPGQVISLGVINNKLYSAIKDQGIFRMLLAEGE